MRFMVLNCSTIFDPANQYKQKVEAKMKLLGIEPAFCKRISKHEYEEQKRLQNGHMAMLLENILADSVISIKDKRKKLKQVRQHHPF